jgi:hypothetical protein
MGKQLQYGGSGRWGSSSGALRVIDEVEAPARFLLVFLMLQ